jgi:hypothetical protein
VWKVRSEILEIEIVNFHFFLTHAFYADIPEGGRKGVIEGRTLLWVERQKIEIVPGR